ncbi:MAG: histidine kinase [Gammaproteobacteria bacterium]
MAQALHPIIARRERFLLYLTVWLAFGALLAGVVAYRGDTTFGWASVFTMPLAILLGLQSLSCWYLVQVLPMDGTPLGRLTGTWVGAGFVMLAIWVAAALGWAWVLRVTVPQALDDEAASGLTPLLLFSGAAGLLVAVLGHYMLVAFERSTQAERRALELRVLARESELRSLRGQLDPHFLFNSLNSVAALIGSDAQSARRMCFLMAGFFRKSLQLGGKHAIPLSEELSLVQTFLSIEEVRFRERLLTRFDVADDTLNLSVPPLVLAAARRERGSSRHRASHRRGRSDGARAQARRTARAHRRESVRPRTPAITWRGRRPRQRALAHRHTIRASRKRRCECAAHLVSRRDSSAGGASDSENKTTAALAG